MKTAEEITRIINTTLVVENKASIKYATEKIQKVMVEFAKEALKNASDNFDIEDIEVTEGGIIIYEDIQHNILNESNIPNL